MEFEVVLKDTMNERNCNGARVIHGLASGKDIAGLLSFDDILNGNFRFGNSRKSPVSRGIADTMVNHPDEFELCNLGVTIVCSGFTVDQSTKKITMESPQVHNGAQTLTNIVAQSKSLIEKDVVVCVKIIATDNLEQEQRIRVATNTHLPIKDTASFDTFWVNLKEEVSRTLPGCFLITKQYELAPEGVTKEGSWHKETVAKRIGSWLGIPHMSAMPKRLISGDMKNRIQDSEFNAVDVQQLFRIFSIIEATGADMIRDPDLRNDMVLYIADTLSRNILYYSVLYGVRVFFENQQSEEVKYPRNLEQQSNEDLEPIIKQIILELARKNSKTLATLEAANEHSTPYKVMRLKTISEKVEGVVRSLRL